MHRESLQCSYHQNVNFDFVPPNTGLKGDLTSSLVGVGGNMNTAEESEEPLESEELMVEHEDAEDMVEEEDMDLEYIKPEPDGGLEESSLSGQV